MKDELIVMLEQLCFQFLKQIVFQKRLINNESKRTLEEVKDNFEKNFRYESKIDKSLNLTEAAKVFDRMQLKEIRMSSITIKQIDILDKIKMELVQPEPKKNCYDCEGQNPIEHIKDFRDL